MCVQDKESMIQVLRAVDKANGCCFGNLEERNLQAMMSAAVGADFQFSSYPFLITAVTHSESSGLKRKSERLRSGWKHWTNELQMDIISPKIRFMNVMFSLRALKVHLGYRSGTSTPVERLWRRRWWTCKLKKPVNTLIFLLVNGLNNNMKPYSLWMNKVTLLMNLKFLILYICVFWVRTQ